MKQWVHTSGSRGEGGLAALSFGGLGGPSGTVGEPCQSSKSLEETEPLAYKMVIFVVKQILPSEAWKRGLLGDSMVTNLPANAGDMDSILGRKIPFLGATKPAQLLSLGREPQLLKCAHYNLCCNKRSHPNEKPTLCN